MGAEKNLFCHSKMDKQNLKKCICSFWQLYRMMIRPLTESSLASALYASVSHLLCAWTWSWRCVCCVHVQHQRQWNIFLLALWWWCDKKGNERKYKLPPRDSSMPSRVDVDVIFSFELRFGQSTPTRDTTQLMFYGSWQWQLWRLGRPDRPWSRRLWP